MRVQSNSHSRRKAREIAWKQSQLFYFRVSASEWIIYCEPNSKEKQWVKQIQPKNVFPTKNKLYWHQFELLGKLAYSYYSDSKPVFKTELCSLSFKISLPANVSFFFCRSLHASCKHQDTTTLSKYFAESSNAWDVSNLTLGSNELTGFISCISSGNFILKRIMFNLDSNFLIPLS